MNATLGTDSEMRLGDVADSLAEARRLGDGARVQAILQSARGLVPRTIDDEMTLGFIHLELGDLRAALARFARVADRRPGVSMAHAGRALTLQLLNQPVEALQAVRAALALDPKDLVALKVLVRIDLDMNLPEEAAGICRRILGLNPGDPDATAMRQQAAVLAAVPLAERIKPREPDRPGYDAYVSLGNNCEAGLQFQRIGYDTGSFFRFTFSSLAATCQLIREDFDGVYLRENLVPLGGSIPMVRDARYQVNFHSELPMAANPADGSACFLFGPDFDRIYDRELAKVRYLVGKGRALAASDQRVLYFVKHEGGHGRARAEELLDLFLARYPRHDFHILFLQTEDRREDDWGVPRLTNRYLPRFAPITQAHDADGEAWGRIFAEFPLQDSGRLPSAP